MTDEPRCKYPGCPFPARKRSQAWGGYDSYCNRHDRPSKRPKVRPGTRIALVEVRGNSTSYAESQFTTVTLPAEPWL